MWTALPRVAAATVAAVAVTATAVAFTSPGGDGSAFRPTAAEACPDGPESVWIEGHGGRDQVHFVALRGRDCSLVLHPFRVVEAGAAGRAHDDADKAPRGDGGGAAARAEAAQQVAVGTARLRPGAVLRVENGNIVYTPPSAGVPPTPRPAADGSDHLTASVSFADGATAVVTLIVRGLAGGEACDPDSAPR